MTINDEKENILSYDGPKSLKKIEARLLEIEHEKPMRIHNLNENFSDSYEDVVEHLDIKFLDVEKAQLLLKRQFILDRRNSWKVRIIWDMLVPIILATVTAYLTATIVAP